MEFDPPPPKDVADLADASNELCVAIETFRIGHPEFMNDFAWKLLLQRKEAVWALLEKFGY